MCIQSPLKFDNKKTSKQIRTSGPKYKRRNKSMKDIKEKMLNEIDDLLKI
jgi:hypothetical protein